VRPEHLGTLRTLRDLADFLASTPASGGRQPSDTTTHQGGDVPPNSVEPVLLGVVAEKTGYPAEMLELGMALDADLGIDSIKRVEILSALQERLPQAPAVRPEHLGTLRTLRDLADFLASTPASEGRRPPDAGTNQGAHAPRSPASPDGTGRLLERSVVRAVPLSNEPRTALNLPAGAEIWVTEDDDGLAYRLSARLERLGHRVRRLPLESLRHEAPPTSLGSLVLLAPVREPGDHFLEEALFGLQRVAAALRRAGAQGGAFFATVSRIDGAFGLVEPDPDRTPFDGGLAGLAKTAAREWPEVHCKALDLAPRSWDEAVDALTEELFLAGPSEVGLGLDGRRTLDRVVEPLTVSSQGGPFESGDVVVLSGGGRGVTAEVAVALARSCRPTLVLLGRSPPPGPEPEWLRPLTGEAEIKRELGTRANGSASPRLVGEQYQQLAAAREVRQTLARLQAEGVKAVYRSVDIRDADAVAAVIRSVRTELGPVRGLVHGAGVLADARIEDKTSEQFARVYGTKVGGLRALLAALDPAELRALVLFSSTTGRLGRAGQADYAIANEVLNKLAHQHSRRLPGCRVLAVNWGPWDGGMVSSPLKRLFAQEGVGLIPLAAGADYLMRELAAPGERAVEVVVLAQANASLPSAPAPPDGTLSVAFERVLEVAEHPVLESHILGDRPVLPMALMLEWLAHAALHQNPGLVFHGCNDLRLLHGVALDGPAPLLRAVAGKAVRRDGFYLVPAELRTVGANGREGLHVRAEVVLATELPTAPPPRSQPGTHPYRHGVEKIYRESLFHGPDLHAIESVEGCGDRGVVARVRAAPAPAAWIQQPLRQRWITDPLAVDGGFQLLIVWSLERHKASCLPCFTRRYRQYRRAFPPDGTRVVVEVTRDGELHALADLDFLDSDGQVVARLEGHESVIDPALARAFRRETKINR
jgi:NAD(P)-dependent dehydrogenase (short-subunit alcohol dehydrogenase family)